MDRFLHEIEPASLALAGVILLVAALLGYREWVDRRGRSPRPSPEDRDHFRRRDRRRSVGLSILSLLALGVVVGSRTPIRADGRPNPVFLGLWLLVFALIAALLTLALVDWYDLRRYARQKKAAIGREQLSILQAEIEQWKGRGEVPREQGDRDPA